MTSACVVVVTQTELMRDNNYYYFFYSPRSTILPKRFFPRRKLRVEQFHRRFLNWCWHSAIAMFAPFAIAARTPGFSRASLLCFRLRVAWIAGSIYTWTGVTGEILFGSPAFAMPLQIKRNESTLWVSERASKTFDGEEVKQRLPFIIVNKKRFQVHFDMECKQKVNLGIV